MADWYGPTDTWPRHNESWWRDALETAQVAGWHLEFFTGTSSHRWGKLRCVRTDDPLAVEPCTIKIDSSGKGAENVARDVPKKIRNCPHRAADPASPSACLARAEERLQDARGLLDAVEAVLDRQGELLETQALLLEAFEEAVNDAEVLLARAADAEADAVNFLESARADLASLTEGLEDPAAGLAAGEVQLAQATQELAAVPVTMRDARPQRLELERLRVRAGELRTRIDGA